MPSILPVRALFTALLATLTLVAAPIQAAEEALAEPPAPPITTMPSISNPTQARLVDDGSTLEYEGLSWAPGTLRTITRRVDLMAGVVLDAPGQPQPNDPEHAVTLVPSPDGRCAAGGAVVHGRWKAIVREFAAPLPEAHR